MYAQSDLNLYPRRVSVFLTDSSRVQYWKHTLTTRDTVHLKTQISQKDAWQPSWRAAATYSQAVRGHLGVPCFLWPRGLQGLRECPSGQEDGAKLKTDVPNKTALQKGQRKHPPPSRSRDFRTHCLFLFPTTTELRKTLFGKVSTMLVRCNSFKFKPYLCLVEKKSVQVILWQSTSEVE